MIRYGFQIKEGEIFDTKIQNYKLVADDMGENIIYKMIPSTYKRLYLFEPLLHKFDIDTVFEILKFNKKLKRQRNNETTSKQSKLDYASTMATVYNYPPTYLTQRRFYLYKICQSLKKNID